MKINNQKMQSLLDMLALTREEETSCDGCSQQLAEFAETRLAGKSLPESLKSIEAHLELCGECREEFEALKLALTESNSEDA